MSSSVSKPIIKQIKDRQDALDFFEHVSLPKNMISNTQITAQPEYDIQFWNAMRNKEAREWWFPRRKTRKHPIFQLILYNS